MILGPILNSLHITAMNSELIFVLIGQNTYSFELLSNTIYNNVSGLCSGLTRRGVARRSAEKRVHVRPRQMDLNLVHL